MSKISVCIPYYGGMQNHDLYIARCVASVDKQICDWEVELVITDEGKMAENSNAAIRKATGDIKKILYMDDFLLGEYALQKIINSLQNSDKSWVSTGCYHCGADGMLFNYHKPYYNDRIIDGLNTIGSPSVIAFKKDEHVFFDESMSWLLDCCFYKRMHDLYGEPCIIEEPLTVIGVGGHQHTHIMSDEEKQLEFIQIQQKYER